MRRKTIINCTSSNEEIMRNITTDESVPLSYSTFTNSFANRVKLFMHGYFHNVYIRKDKRYLNYVGNINHYREDYNFHRFKEDALHRDYNLRCPMLSIHISLSDFREVE